MIPFARSLARDPFFRFLALGLVLYAGWYLLYAGVLHPWGRLDRAVIESILWIAGGTLRTLGFSLLPEPPYDGNRYLGIDGGSYLWIGDPCNGVELFAAFLVFIVAYPGPWKHKLWFGALGLLSIHLINCLRVVVLCWIARFRFDWLNFQHDYTFYVVVYGWVFLLWYIWVKRFGPRREANAAGGA